MSKASVKKALSQLDKKELVETLMELYAVRKEAKEYLEYWASPDPEAVAEDYSKRAFSMFFYSTGKNRSNPSATEIKTLVSHFSTLVYDAEKESALLIYIAELYLRWVAQRTSGFLQYEKNVRRAFDNAFKRVEEAGLEDVFGLRLDRLSNTIETFFSDPPEPRRRGWRRWLR